MCQGTAVVRVGKLLDSEEALWFNDRAGHAFHTATSGDEGPDYGAG